MPLAAPVTIADLPWSCIGDPFVSRIVVRCSLLAHWTKAQLLHRRCTANLAARFSLRHIERNSMFNNSRFAQGLFILVAATVLALPHPARSQSSTAGSTAPTRSVLDHDAQGALKSLYGSAPAAKALGDKAIAVLVFPEIRKAAFLLGAQGGDGVLFEKGQPSGYYNSGALSVGLQAGAQSYGYALFFLRPEDLAYLKSSDGWSLGAGPSLVVADAGMAKDVSTLTGQSGVYAFIFDQKGLMGGMGLVGQKITPIER